MYGTDGTDGVGRADGMGGADGADGAEGTSTDGDRRGTDRGGRGGALHNHGGGGAVGGAGIGRAGGSGGAGGPGLTGGLRRLRALRGAARRGGGPRAAAEGAGRPSRRLLLTASVAAATGGLGLLSGCGTVGTSDAKASSGHASSSGPPGAHSPSPSPSRTHRPPELPRGGRELFPRYRLFGYCGLPGAKALGRLGTGDPDQRAGEIEKKAKDFAGGREPLPVLELLATVANGGAGPDGTYRTRTSSDTIKRFHDIARDHHALLLLNIQPGRADLLGEVKALRDWLVHPDVGVALDPEWEMGPGEVPGNTYGHTDGHELDAVSRYLSDLVHDHDLPEKPLVFHQVADSVVRERGGLGTHPGVVPIMSADGIGSPGLKRTTWHQLVRDMPKGLHTGFKLFFDEDTRSSRLMTPHEVLALEPQPEYVMYE